MTRQQQRQVNSMESVTGSSVPARVIWDADKMPSPAASPPDATALADAQQREAAIRAIGLDGIVLGGATIRRLRRAAGLSSDALAARIGYSGALVRAWEAGRRSCPPCLYLPLVEAISSARRDKVLRPLPALPVAHITSDAAA